MAEWQPGPDGLSKEEEFSSNIAAVKEAFPDETDAFHILAEAAKKANSSDEENMNAALSHYIECCVPIVTQWNLDKESIPSGLIQIIAYMEDAHGNALQVLVKEKINPQK